MEPKPKERIVFDEDLYYGDEGEEMAINDLMERDGLTEGEVREVLDEGRIPQIHRRHDGQAHVVLRL